MEPMSFLTKGLSEVDKGASLHSYVTAWERHISTCGGPKDEVALYVRLTHYDVLGDLNETMGLF